MKLTLLALLSTAAIAGSGWSQDTNADNTAKNTRDGGTVSYASKS